MDNRLQSLWNLNSDTPYREIKYEKKQHTKYRKIIKKQNTDVQKQHKINRKKKSQIFGIVTDNKVCSSPHLT